MHDIAAHHICKTWLCVTLCKTCSERHGRLELRGWMHTDEHSHGGASESALGWNEVLSEDVNNALSGYGMSCLGTDG